MPHRPFQNSPEVGVLVICARRNLGAMERARLSEISGSSRDWPLLLRLADQNGLLPLLYEHIVEAAPAAIPPDSLAHLREQCRNNALRALFLSAELFRILDVFRRKGIAAIPYKGPVLAARAYGNPSRRQFDDLDIVVSQKLIPLVYEELTSIGYDARLPREFFLANEPRAIPGEYVFVHKTNGAMVEVHTEWTLRHFPRRPDLSAMMGRSVVVSLDGRDVPAFAVEDAVLMLAVHGAKDFWSRLIWVADIAELVQQSASIDWERLFSEAARLKAARMMNLALSLAHEILGLALPAEIARQLKNDRGVKRLVFSVREQLLNNGNPSVGLFRRSLYRIRMAENSWDGLRYWLRLSTAPAEEDWAIPYLRGNSRWYSFLRPFRLWKKYGSRTPRT